MSPTLRLFAACALASLLPAFGLGAVSRAEQQAFGVERGERAARFDEKNPTKGGERVDVIIDAALRTSGKATTGVGSGGKLYAGRTVFQAPQIDAVTYVQSKEKLSPGEVVRCVIVGSDGYDLTAKPVDEVEKKVSLGILHRH